MADKNKILASNPAARAANNQTNPNPANVNKTKKSWKDKVKEGLEYTKDGLKEVVNGSTEEEKKQYDENLKPHLDKKIAQQAEGLALEGGALGAVAAPGAKGKVAATALAGLGANAAANEGKKADEKIKERKEGSEKAPETKGEGGNAGVPKTESETDKTKKKILESGEKSGDTYIAKVAKQQGLGKYVNEDGTVDYDRLQKSKVGFQILNAILGGIGGAAAGAAFKDGPDMSKGMLAQAVGKRDKVVEEAQKTAEQEKQNANELATFTQKLGLQGEQAIRAQKEMARFMSNLSYDDQVRMMNYMKGMSLQDAMKLGFAQNPYGAMGSIAGGLGGFMGAGAGSDEACKAFASRKLFR